LHKTEGELHAMRVFAIIVITFTIFNLIADSYGKNYPLLCQSYVQKSELDKPCLIIMHTPSTEVGVASIHPKGSLFETGLSLERAINDHKNVIEYLKRREIQVITVRDVLTQASYKALTRMAALSTSYVIDEEFSFHDLTENQQYLVSQQYKEEVLSVKTPSELVDIILTRPKVTLRPSDRNTYVETVRTSYSPLGNLVFTRDQQIVTANGLVIANLNSRIRNSETKIMKMVFDILGIQVIGEIEGEGRLEGGDFFPITSELSMLGIGLRSNREAANQLMKKNLLGTKEFAVVVDLYDYNQDRMHLDTFFNIVNRNTVLLLDLVIGENAPFKREVEVYIQDDDTKEYKHVETLEFSRYLTRKGFRIIPITVEEQLNYMINFLNLGTNELNMTRIVTPNLYLKDKIAKFYQTMNEENPVIVDFINYERITAMYGAIHCSTQVFRYSQACQTENTDNLSHFIISDLQDRT